MNEDNGLTEVEKDKIRAKFWKRSIALLWHVTEPITELAPVLLDYIAVDLQVDRLGLFFLRKSNGKKEFTLTAVKGKLLNDKLGEVYNMDLNFPESLIKEVPTEGVGWDLYLGITPLIEKVQAEKLGIDENEIIAVLAIDDTTTARKFSDGKKDLISHIHWALRGFFGQRAIIEAFRDRDPKTGLLNDKAFRARQKEIEELRKRKDNRFYSVAFIDLDKFKDVNTKYGEPFGDVVLKKFSHIIRDHFRAYDIIFRVGGEEFVIIMEDFGEVLVKRLNSLLTYLQKVIVEDDGKKLHGIPFSGGVVDVLPDETMDSAIKRANQKKQLAKEQGRAVIITD